MGIRVHKVIGYGLTDVKTRKYQIADGRINRKSPLLDSYSLDAKDYLEWLSKKYEAKESSQPFNIDLWLKQEDADKMKSYRMSDTIHYGTEYMMKNVMLLKPLSMKDWQRHDDSIDYLEETYFRDGDSQLNHVTVLKHGIYPYNGSYMDKRTGEQLTDEVMWWIRGENSDTLAQSMKFKDAVEARENVVPKVPQEIRDLAEYGKLFTNDDVWKQLRPMLYVYWS